MKIIVIWMLPSLFLNRVHCEIRIWCGKYKDPQVFSITVFQLIVVYRNILVLLLLYYKLQSYVIPRVWNNVFYFQVQHVTESYLEKPQSAHKKKKEKTPPNIVKEKVTLSYFIHLKIFTMSNSNCIKAIKDRVRCFSSRSM